MLATRVSVRPSLTRVRSISVRAQASPQTNVPASSSKPSSAPLNPILVLNVLAMTAALPAHADGLLGDFQGFNPAEIAILAAPLVFYGIFFAYRTSKESKGQQVDWIEFAQIIVAVIIVLNIVSILAFNTRIF